MDALPKETTEAVRRYRGQRGPQKSPTKELVSLRVDREVVAAYRATGAGCRSVRTRRWGPTLPNAVLLSGIVPNEAGRKALVPVGVERCRA